MSFFKRHVFFCNQQRPAGHPRGCCADRGGNDVGKMLWDLAAADELEGVKINTAGCLGRCDIGPAVVIYPEGVWYSPQSPEDIKEIYESHIKGGTPVERLKV